MRKWSITTMLTEADNRFHKVIFESGTEEVVAIIDNLDTSYVNRIVNRHNDALSEALKDGVELAKDIYRGKGGKNNGDVNQ